MKCGGCHSAMLVGPLKKKYWGGPAKDEFWVHVYDVRCPRCGRIREYHGPEETPIDGEQIELFEE